MKLDKLKEIIHLGGGNVEGRVVTEPGVILLSETKTTSVGGEVLVAAISSHSHVGA
jgi:hypothetical protein